MTEGGRPGSPPKIQGSLKSSEKERKISPARERFLRCLSVPCLPSTRLHSLITHRNLRYCASLDDRSVAQIAFHCPDLRTLDIGECSLFTDTSLFSIAPNIHVLHALFMTQLPRCTVKGVLKLVDSLTLLEKIKLSVCSESHTAIDEADIQNLHGRKSVIGKYIKADNKVCKARSIYEMWLNLVCDAAFTRTSLNYM